MKLYPLIILKDGILHVGPFLPDEEKAWEAGDLGLQNPFANDPRCVLCYEDGKQWRQEREHEREMMRACADRF